MPKCQKQLLLSTFLRDVVVYPEAYPRGGEDQFCTYFKTEEKLGGGGGHLRGKKYQIFGFHTMIKRVHGNIFEIPTFSFIWLSDFFGLNILNLKIAWNYSRCPIVFGKDCR